MDPKIEFNGTAILREDYTNPNDIAYSVVLSLRAKVSGGVACRTPTESTITVPIRQEQYQKLKQSLKDSRAEEPRLRVNGDLSIRIHNTCIN